MDKTIICPGCGWTGTVEGLVQGVCPRCRYENRLDPGGLFTLLEMLDDDVQMYDGVYMDLFLKSLFKFLGYPDNQDEWSDYLVVHPSDIDGG